MHTDVVWDELQKRKTMSLREKFEVRKAVWRERKSISIMKKLKKQKIKEAKKMRKEYEKKTKERFFLDRLSKRRRKAAKESEEAIELQTGPTSSTKGVGGGAARRTASSKHKPFS